MRKGIFVLSFLLAFSLSPRLWAQNPVSGGSISGVVTDSSGGAVAGVTVTLTNVATSVQATTKTNGSGLYSFPVVNVGVYAVGFTKEGFKTTEVKDLVVQVGQTSSVNVSLEVGSLSQSVTVTASAPLLRPTDSTISTVVDQKLIEDLPLSGRRYTDFVLLTPNVLTDGDFGLVTIGGQQGGSDSGYANGNGSNSFTVDGANDTSNFFGDARGRTRVPYIFGEQAIQEFQVADTPYSAAYGGAGSGFVNTVTKSGTDKYHGDAFYYNRNSGTGADDAVDHGNGIKTPLNVLQQFGADLGGPVVQHKAFFYFDYEQQRQAEPISVLNPTFGGIGESNLSNFFSNVPNGTALPAPNSSVPVPQSFPTAPAPGGPNYPAYLQQVSNVVSLIQKNLGQGKRRRDDLSFFPKLDWQPGPGDHLTFIYNYNRFNSPGGTFTFNPITSPGTQSLPNSFVRDHHATVHWTHTFSGTLLNDLHVSFLRDDQIGTPSGLIPTNLATINLNANGGFIGLGNPFFANSVTKEFQWEIGEQFNHVRGRHSLKFGFDFNRTHINDFFPGGFQGSFTFSNLTNFALGLYHTFFQVAGNPTFPFTVPYYGFYAQDKFQIRRNLTIDFGLREDFQVFPQPKGNPLFPLTSQFPNHYQRVSPRLGFAYQPFGDAKTVVRGGFGMFYEVLNGINYENAVKGNGLPTQAASAFVFIPNNNTTPPNMLSPEFPTALSPTDPRFGPASSNLSFFDPGFQTPYILSSSLEIQRELFSHTTVTIGTMWTHGVHIISSSAFDRNLFPPTGTTTYTFCPAGTTIFPCVGRTVVGPNLDSGLLTEGFLNPNLQQLNATISPGINNYNSFYFQLQRRVSRGLAVMTSYTFSKNFSSHGSDFNNQFDFSNTHGPALLDQRHRLSVALAYSPDASHLSNDVTRALLSNWTISTLSQFNSGRPYTGLLLSPAAGGNNLNDSAFNESTGNTAFGLDGGFGPVPGIGYNAFYGPWIQEIDLGIARAFHITERHTITLKAQAFNLFNHPNFFVANGGGILANQFNANGSTCGDGATTNQTCFLVPDPAFGTKTSINELNGPRIFQFAFAYRF